jgi:hypothetical protein
MAGQGYGVLAPGTAPRIGQVAGTLVPPVTMPRAGREPLAPPPEGVWASLARSIGQLSPTGQAILKASDQQRQQGFEQRLLARRQQLLEEQESRQVTRDRFTTFVELSKVKSKSLRNLMFDRWATDLQARGEQVPPDFVEAFKKSGLEEGQQMAELLAPMFTSAGMDPTIAARMLQEGGDPAQLIDVVKLGQASQKLRADADEEARIAQRQQDYRTLGGASGVVQPAPTERAGAPTPTPTPTAAPPARTQALVAPPAIEAYIEEAHRLYPQVRKELIRATMLQESSFNPTAKGGAGEIGLMQLKPGTAKDMGVDPNDPRQNVLGGTRYLAQQMTTYKGNEAKALAAYNQGPGNVPQEGPLPEKGQRYAQQVLGHLTAGGPAAPDTRAMVAGPGAPAPAAQAQDQARVAAMDQRIAWLDREIGAGMGSGRERTRGYVNEMQQERTRLIGERDKLIERGSKERELQSEPQRAGARATAEAEAKADVERRQQAQPMLPKDRRKFLTDLRSDIRQEPTFKIYQGVRNGYQNVQVGAKSNSAQGDLAIINGMAKILDPEGVVMTGEARNVEQAQGQLERWFMSPQKFFEGDRLTTTNRQKFLELARNVAQEKLTTAQQELRAVYEPLAKEGNIDFNQLLPLGDLKTPEGQSLLEDMRRGK